MSAVLDDEVTIDQADDLDNEAEAPTEDAEGQQPEGEQVDAEAATDKAEDEVTITLGDEQPAQTDEEQETPVIRSIRKLNREKDRRIRELENKLKEVTAPAVQAPAQLSEEPTLEQFDFDSDAYKTALRKWDAEQREVQERQRKQADAEKAAQDAWAQRVETYQKAKAALKVRDYEEAEAAVEEAFSTTQQGVILSGAEQPAQLVYALGRNPAKAKELAAITDPVKFAFAVAKLETQLKVTPRKSAPVPERAVRGSSPAAQHTSNAQLDNLLQEARKSGDYSKYHAVKNARAKP